MQIYRVALLLLSLNSVLARRIQKRHGSTVEVGDEAEGGKTCHVVENDHSLKYGIKGSWKVSSCVTKCKFHIFLSETVTRDVISDAEKSEDERHCKCYTSPKFWGIHKGNKKFWFQYNSKFRGCSVHECKSVFLTWANMFNRKKMHLGEGEQMPVNKFIESQEGYDFPCDDAEPEGLYLPSPASKIHELRLQIEQCTDPAEKARLQALLDELLADKEVEVFAYDLDGEWGPEHDVDEAADGEHHTFFLKPCVSQKGTEVTDLKEIFELCGPGELGTSMKGGQLRVMYMMDDPWGPERDCSPSEVECEQLKNIVADEGLEGELLSFRLRPCKSPSGEEVTELSEIFATKGCGPPTTKEDADGYATLLPVKMDVSRKYDEAAPSATAEDSLKYPCE